MAITEPIEGRYVDLRSCAEEDAEFTREIRQDPEFARFLPVINNTIDQQRDWICRQREKEGDYFFVVWDKEGRRIGTISIYDVHGDRAESGRLAIRSRNPLEVIEAQLLSFRFGFNTLDLKCIDGYIYAENSKAIRFNKTFGGRHSEPEQDEYGRQIIRIENWYDDFEKADRKISSVLYRNRRE